MSKALSISAMKPVISQKSDSCFNSAKKERFKSVIGWTLPLANEQALYGRESVASSCSKKITFSPPLFLSDYEGDGPQKSIENIVSPDNSER